MREEVIDNYLLWELSKPCIRSLISQPHVLRNQIKQIKQDNRNKLQSLTLSQKLNSVKQFFSPRSNRADLLASYSWTKKEYPVRDLGTVLPVCGDLPLEVITQSFPEVIEYVKKKLDEPDQERSIRYITDLMKIPDILYMFPPMVIEPGSCQRNVNVMKIHHKSGNWNIYSTLGYIEDGNHRAIALVIACNLELIPCYVGK